MRSRARRSVSSASVNTRAPPRPLDAATAAAALISVASRSKPWILSSFSIWRDWVGDYGAAFQFGVGDA